MKRLAIALFVASALAGCGSAQEVNLSAPAAVHAAQKAPAEAFNGILSAPYPIYGVAFTIEAPANPSPDLPVGFSGARYKDGKWTCMVVVGNSQGPLNGKQIVKLAGTTSATVIEAADDVSNIKDISNITVK